MEEIKVGSPWINARTGKRYKVTHIDAHSAYSRMIHYSVEGALGIGYFRPLSEWLEPNRDGSPRFIPACCVEGCPNPHSGFEAGDGELDQSAWPASGAFLCSQHIDLHVGPICPQL